MTTKIMKPVLLFEGIKEHTWHSSRNRIFLRTKMMTVEVGKEFKNI